MYFQERKHEREKNRQLKPLKSSNPSGGDVNSSKATYLFLVKELEMMSWDPGSLLRLFKTSWRDSALEKGIFFALQNILFLGSYMSEVRTFHLEKNHMQLDVFSTSQYLAALHPKHNCTLVWLADVAPFSPLPEISVICL